MSEFLQVHGARIHNLKNLSVAIPLNAFTVVTGVSGSGKSSLAFDTIYAEGQRRYVESLSAYARQFLERMEKPDVDAVEGIAPAIAIRQKSSSRNPRSSVATATEIYDYLRLLFARVGVIYCPDCNLAVARDDVDAATAALLAEAAGRRALLLFPVQARGPQPGITPRLGELRARGFNRLWQEGKTVEFSTPESLLDLDLEQPLYVLVDRLRLEADPADARARLVDGIEIAYREAGEVLFVFPDAGDPLPRLPPRRFSLRFECKQCRRGFEASEPSLFSFNSPHGACPRCQGFGRASEISRERVIPDPGRSLEQGAIEPWNTPRGLRWRNALKRVSERSGLPLDVPWRQLTASQQALVWNGVGRFPGVEGFFQALERKKYKVHVRVLISRYREYTLCPACGGNRLRPEALWVQLRARADAGAPARLFNIAQVTALTVAQAQTFFAQLELSPQAATVAQAVLLEVRRRLEFLLKVGLEYLSLDRAAATLSGGEAQRIQLATCLGSQLVGALYVLDEPSIGLHPRDTARLISILRELRDLGNTMLVVEHDAEVMRASDHLLDLGPGAGEQGGELVAAGTWKMVSATPASLTGQYLR
ncbi:MAG: excinuclease ABC subunit UvrA, partial [Terriglobales bacterium]